ncbi:MAG: TRAP transporter large permease [Salinarimonas sp.]
MTAFIVANLAPIMFGSLIAIMILGYPIAFSLAALGLAYAMLGIWLGLFTPGFMQALPERLFSVLANETLLAIPFFAFMGLVLERSRMAEDLLDTMGQLFGSLRGGLAYAVIFVGAILAAATGVIAAAVIAMGLISLPIMLRYRYDPRLATGVIAASGTLAQIMPPSLVLIVLADQLQRSVGDMYAGALLPALALAGLYAVYVALISFIRPQMAPALPPEARSGETGMISLIVTLAIAMAAALIATWALAPHVARAPLVYGGAIGALTALAIALVSRRLIPGLIAPLAERVVLALVPPLGLILLVLGAIFVGIATPTEGGALGALGALILAFTRRRLDLTLLRGACEGTLQLCSFVIFILIGARVFALTFYGVDGHIWVKDWLLALPGGETGFLVFVGLLVFALGFFLDFFEIVFILVPLLIVPAQALGIDLIFFGVLLALAFQTSFLTPPFGFALFYLRSVVPATDGPDPQTGEWRRGVDTLAIYRGAFPFVLIQLAMIAIVLAFPQMVTHYQRTGPGLTVGEVERRLDDLRLPGLEEDGGFGLTPPGFDMPGIRRD